MKKKKEITMWAIWSPYYKEIIPEIIYCSHIQVWRGLERLFNSNESSLKQEGYRAVKGKFVWEEK